MTSEQPTSKTDEISAYTFTKPKFAQPPYDGLPIWNIFNDPYILSCEVILNEMKLMLKVANPLTLQSYYYPNIDPYTQLSSVYSQCLHLQQKSQDIYANPKELDDHLAKINEDIQHEDPHIWKFRESIPPVKPAELEKITSTYICK